MATINNNKEIIQLLKTAKNLLKYYEQLWDVRKSIEKIDQAIKTLK